MQMNDLLHRDEAFAKREASRGMHHSFYIFAILSRLLATVDMKRTSHDYDAVSSGAHWGDFVDPVTGKVYEIKIMPKPEKARAGVA